MSTKLYTKSNTKKITVSAMFISLGVVLGNLIYIPVGVSKCFPIQHTINILSAITLGPVYSTIIAFLISLIRNMLGTGSLLAFPGSMIGAFLAGIIYKKTKNNYLTAIGEVFGTGVIGGFAAFPIAKYILGKEVLAYFFVYPFILSSAGGAIIALILVKTFEKIKLKQLIL